VLRFWFCLVNLIGQANGFAFADRIAKPGKFFARKKPLARVLLVALDSARRIDMSFGQKPTARSPRKTFRYDGKETVCGKGAFLEFRVQCRDLALRQYLGLYASIRLAKAPQRDLVGFGRLRFASLSDVLRSERIDKARDRERCPPVGFFRLRVGRLA
jgi:hypothetical protein